MTKELGTVYNPKETEEKIYENWMDKGYFHAEPEADKESFTIVIPPPNITGQLHMGHALDNAIQDAIIRTKRMQGYSALWMPGTDHASIATEVRILEEMAEEGKTKENTSRDEFLERAWEWKDRYGGRIVEQLKKLGSSLDWERERFTMDEGLSHAVRVAFKQLYDKGLIYQGDRMINWCPSCETALSDAEVEHEDQAGNLWHLQYKSEDGGEGVVVATTRPETMLGDTAVAVHPEDERYKDLIGKHLILPLMDRKIPVIADEFVDKEFGTGAVKVTPAHDPNDHEMGERHDLPIIKVLDEVGIVTEEGGKYSGLDRYEARKQVVADLEELGLLANIEDHEHSVGHCYRCDSIIEPMISKQWFVKMKPLAEPAIKAVEEGDIEFIPDRFSKVYFNWMYNIRDWCISRQLWWGHRIPAYTCESCGTLMVEVDGPDVCENCGSSNITQDTDVLDTWFSSALWPFSTLGWPEETPDLEYFYPTNVLVTAYDIIFFWVARMIFMGIELTGEIPFEFVNIHGIVRDSLGRKMSKSLDNGIDPLEVIEKYGADSLRFSLATGVSPGNDMRYFDEKVESARNFTNKIWNASRFVMMNIKDDRVEPIDESKLDIADQWILTRLNQTIENVTENMDKMELGLAAQRLYDFTWSEFCDWYIEMAKPRLYGEDEELKQATINVLVYVLTNTLKLLHPFMPFITEEIYTSLPARESESIMISKWPEMQYDGHGEQADRMQEVMGLIRAVRNTRAEMNVPPARKVVMTVLSTNKEAVEAIEACTDYIKHLAYASEVVVVDSQDKVPADTVSVVSSVGEAFLPLAEMIDIADELTRVHNDLKKNESEIARAEGKLSNKGFVDNAPEKVVEEEREKLQKYTDIKEKLEERIRFLEELA